jgi:N-acetylglucosaminyl-diphospho-decaprenol L-rhamnosyltransferase
MSEVAILIVTFQNAPEIAACLDAALAQGVEAEVVVVDNASTDGTREILRGYRDRVRILEQPVNEGFSSGVNRAFAHSASPWTLLLNPDVLMEARCVRALVDHLTEQPQAGAAAAWLEEPDGTPQHFARREIGVRDALWTMTDLGRRLDRRLGGRAARHRRYEDEWARAEGRPLVVDCPAAACVLVRSELLRPEPLDPALPLFFSDAALWRQLRHAGWRLEVTPRARARHHGATSVMRADTARIRAEWVASLRRYLAPETGRAGRAALFAGLLTDALVSGARARTTRHEPQRGLAAVNAVGTLGGLGLPRGVRPWLSQ